MSVMNCSRIVVLISLMAAGGCGTGEPSGDVVKTVPAAGTVKLKGTPLAFYQITLFPEGGRPAVGVTDENGQFTLGTNEPGDGAVPGTHKVALTWVGPPSTDPGEGVMEFSSPPAPTQPIHKKFFNAETSGLTALVPESGVTDLEINLP